MEITQSIIINVVLFVAGFFTGFIVRGTLRVVDRQPDFYRNFVLVCVVAIWSISVIVDILSPAYETSFALHGLMGAIVGFFYKPINLGK